jgi:hypothetical protein
MQTAVLACAPMMTITRLGAPVAAMLVLLAPALWNGFPLLQYDTGGYLARWSEGTLELSRAALYGLMLATSAPWNFWPVVVVQAALTVWVVALVQRAHGFAARPLLLVGITALLSVATALPWLASILLTDIFAGLAVLALYLLVMRRETLRRAEVAGLIVLVAFAAATHSATFVMLLALLLAATLVRLIDRRLVPPADLGRGVLALALGIALTLAANFAVTRQLTWTPGGVSLVFGRMLQDGIVKRYLDEHCPDPRLRLCAHRNELPSDADLWFWGSDLFDRLGRFPGLGREMQTIVLESIAAYPWQQLERAGMAAAKQLVLVGSGEGIVTTIWHTYAIVARDTPGAVPAMRGARQQQGGIDFALINRVHVPAALASMLLLLIGVIALRRRPCYADIGMLAAAVLLALLANAVICGVLANPHDRYGARIVWLATLVVALAAVRMSVARNARAIEVTARQ